jgi:hypothetical protein
VYKIAQLFQVQRRKLQKNESQEPVKKQEKTMAGSTDSHIVELHTKAAYAHEAAAHVHSTGDHASAQELAKKALVYSVEAVKCTEEIAKSAPQPMQV